MKMFLTRIGFGSKVVITGDLSQKRFTFSDTIRSGTGIESIGTGRGYRFFYLTNKDVVRHPLVQKIVHAYEKYEARENYKESRKKQAHRQRAGKR